MQQQVTTAMPLLEAVEHAALRAGVPVDARIESGRTPIHALQRLWEAEHFDRIVVPAPAGRSAGLHAEGPDLDAHARPERDADPPAGPGVDGADAQRRMPRVSCREPALRATFSVERTELPQDSASLHRLA